MPTIRKETDRCIILHFADGDTVQIIHECRTCSTWHKRYVRIAGIESPELKGPERAQALEISRKCDELWSLTIGELISKQRGSDRYGRIIGDIGIDGKLLSSMLVDKGFSYYTRRSDTFKNTNEVKT